MSPPTGSLRAEVVAIGTELLLGDNVDTNSAWISARLGQIGVEVVRHTTVGDGMDQMIDALRRACAHADVVLVTGGLGPTQDDLTRVALAQVAGVELVRDQAMVDDIAAAFASRGRGMPSTNLQQADLPDGAWWLTRVGSAPGLGLTVGDTVVFCMPGVPREMQLMMDADVIPTLQSRGGLGAIVSRAVRTTGMSEGGMAATLADLVTQVEQAENPTIAFLASRGEVRVKVTGRAASREQALAVCEPVVAQVVELLGAGVVGMDEEGVEHDIARRLAGADLTVAVAESITGGGVGARLVGVPGASKWFQGGLVTYATQSKITLAGVDAGLLDRVGPVSQEVAEALAEAAADRLGADIGLSIVGVAGPSTQGGQDVGTVWIGTVDPGGFPRAVRLTMGGRSRADIQEFAVAAALTALHRLVVRLTG